MSDLRNPAKHDDLMNYQLKTLLRIGGAPAIRLCEGRYGVSRLQWRLLAAVVEDGPMSPSDLSQRTLVQQAQVSRAIVTLAEKGLVERRKDAGDRRHATLKATAAGHALYQKLFPQLAQINRRIVAALDEYEVLVFQQCLKKLTDRAQQIFAEGGGVDVRANRRLGGSRRVWASEVLRTD